MHPDDALASIREASRVRPLSRRDFVRVLSAASVAGPGMASAAFAGMALTSSQRAEAGELIAAGLGKLPRIKLGTKMGNMMVTQMCICQDWNSDLFAPALEMGVNFIHKAGYWGKRGPVPDVIKALPRESYYTDITVDNTPNSPDDFDRAYNQVTSSLEANGLKYYDIFRAHFGWKGVGAFNKGDNASYKAFLKLKKEGKVRYFGVSQHPYTPDGGGGYRESIDNYAETISAEIDSGLIDCMQVWFSYGYPRQVEEIFAKASAAGIGMTAMKVYAHGGRKIEADKARMEELKAAGWPGKAAYRHALAVKRPDGKPIFQTCVSALRNQSVFEENMGAVSHKIALLDGYAPSIA